MFRAHRIVLVVSLVAAGVFQGCTCNPVTPQPAARASLIARFTAGNTVQSDGTTPLEFTLTALNKSHGADLNPITVSAPQGKGFFAKHGDQNLQPDTFTTTPSAQGSLDVDFVCASNLNEAVNITATNTDATAGLVVQCTAPQGQLVINIDQTDCTQAPNGPIDSDGQSSCTIALEVHTHTETVDIPFAGTINVKVTGAVPLNATDVPDTNVISTQAGAAGQQAIAVPLDAQGKGTFFFDSPSVPETATLELDANNVTTTTDVIVGVFINKADLTINPLTKTVTAGDTVDFTLTGVDAHGNATGAAVALTVDDPNAQIVDSTGAATTSVPLDAATGIGHFSIVTPSTITQTTTENITATLDFGNGVQKTAIATLTVQLAGTLVLDVQPIPAQLKSSDPLQTKTTLHVSLTKDSNPVANGSVDCVIPASSTALLQFATGNKTQQTISTFDATGNATIDIEVVPPANGQEPVPTSTGIVICTGHDGNPANDTQPDQVSIPITRDPLLQNIVFISVTPDVALGVQGSNLPATAVVQFQLLDDSGNPIPNVAVSFSKNATADPAISVLPNAISDAAGNVHTVLSTGTSPGPVTVIAEATVTDPNGAPVLDANGFPVHKFAQSAAIAIVGLLPSFETSSFDCTAPASFRPYTVSCSARLVDRFSNAVPKQLVQFLAESGGTIPDVVTDDEGFAQVTIKGTDEFRPGADVGGANSWSYGAVVPLNQGDMTADASFTQADIDACYDGNSNSACDLLKLCNDPQLAVFCPLPNFAQCGAELNKIVDVVQNPPDAFTVATNAQVAAHVAEYIAHTRDCGFPLSCLVGIAGGAGLDATQGDECPVSLGCMDFDTSTPCQQDGLRSLTAATRGAEAFTDTNGNGRFDFSDINHDGVMEQNEAPPACANCTSEPFVDLPEPFLDRNDNCQRDDFTNVARFNTRPILKVENTDQFVDVDGNRVFGFTVGGATQTTNGVWDPDTLIFHTAHVLELEGQSLKVGVACNNPGGQTQCPNEPVGTTALCHELEPGRGLATECPTVTLNPSGPATETVNFVWEDANGNCPSPGFASTATVAFTGPITVVGDVTATLDEGLCGFNEVSNPTLPFCRAVTGLGAPVFSLAIAANCQPTNNPPAGTLTFTLNGLTQNIEIPVSCP